MWNEVDDIDDWSSVAESDPEHLTESGFQENSDVFEIISSLDLEDFNSIFAEDDQNESYTDTLKQAVLYVNNDQNHNDEENMLIVYGLKLGRIYSVFNYGLEQISWLAGEPESDNKKFSLINFVLRSRNQLLNMVYEPKKFKCSEQQKQLLAKCDILFDSIMECLLRAKRLGSEKVGYIKLLMGGLMVSAIVVNIIGGLYNFNTFDLEEILTVLECMTSIANSQPMSRTYLMISVFTSETKFDEQIEQQAHQYLMNKVNTSMVGFTRAQHSAVDLETRLQALYKRQIHVPKLDTTFLAACYKTPSASGPIIEIVDSE